MTFIFGKVGLIYSIFDNEDDEEQEDFFIEEIRYCDCFFDEFQYLIMKNKYKIGFKEIYNEFADLPRKFRLEDCFLYYSRLSIFCCEACVNFISRVGLIDSRIMDENCHAERVDYCCLYYLSRETVFNCICSECQKTLLKLVSRKLNSNKLK